MQIITKFDIFAAHVYNPSNVVFGREVVLGCLTFELSTNVVQQVSENEVSLYFDATGALLEIIW